MKRCSVCGRENMDHENFCSSCGNPLMQSPATRACPSCNNVVGLEDQFCDHCGSALPPVQPNPAGSFVHGVANATRPMVGGVSSPPPAQIQVGPQVGPLPTPTVRSMEPKKPVNTMKIFLLSFGITLIIGVVAALVYIFMFDDDNPQSTSNIPSSNQPASNTNSSSTSNSSSSTSSSSSSQQTQSPNPTGGISNNNQSPPVTGLGYYEIARGSLPNSIAYYQVADINGDGITDFLVGVNDGGGRVDLYNWNGSNFTSVVYMEIEDEIYDISASAPRGNYQVLYIPASNKMLYTLELNDAGNYIYDSIEMTQQAYTVLDGYLDQDNKIDYVFLLERDNSFVFSFSPTSDPPVEMEVSEDVFNAYLTDVDGDGISDLLYFDFDQNVGLVTAFTIWDSSTHTYQYVGHTTFGELLQNYYPYDIDRDGVSEIITTNYVYEDDRIEVRVWKWDPQKLQFIVIEIFTIEHPTVTFATPIPGDFNGDGVVDIMVVFAEDGDLYDNFIMYTR